MRVCYGDLRRHGRSVGGCARTLTLSSVPARGQQRERVYDHVRKHGYGDARERVYPCLCTRGCCVSLFIPAWVAVVVEARERAI